MSGNACVIIIMARQIMAKAQSFIDLNKCLKKDDMNDIIDLMNHFINKSEDYLLNALKEDCKNK